MLLREKEEEQGGGKEILLSVTLGLTVTSCVGELQCGRDNEGK